MRSPRVHPWERMAEVEVKVTGTEAIKEQIGQNRLFLAILKSPKITTELALEIQIINPSLKSSINEGEGTMPLQEVKSDTAKYYEQSTRMREIYTKVEA